jgi:hypothetical protein
MAVLHSPESDYAKEMRKHEAQHTPFGPGERPYVYQPFPTRMYKAGRSDAGPVVIVDALDAANDTEQRNLESRGYVAGGQGAAMDAFHAGDAEIAKLAANRAHQERTMSPAAQREAAAADDATMDHLPVIPETPIKRRGRPAKQKVTHE